MFADPYFSGCPWFCVLLRALIDAHQGLFVRFYYGRAERAKEKRIYFGCADLPLGHIIKRTKEIRLAQVRLCLCVAVNMCTRIQ